MHHSKPYERGAEEVAPSRIRKRFGRLRPGLAPSHAASTPRSPSSFQAGPAKDLA
jgi:hypothetical protein